MVVPDVLYELLPIAGFALTASSLFILVAMHNDRKGAFLFLYGFAVTDMITGLSMLYAGFHGVLQTTYGESSLMLTPLKCIKRAVHVSLWCWMDYANVLVLAILCVDRFVSVVFGRHYNKLSKLYCHFPVFIVIFFCSAVTLVPAWSFAVESHTNTSITVSSLCYFEDIVGKDFYYAHMQMRLWSPIAGIAVLSITFLLYTLLKMNHTCSYGWSEDVKQAQTLYLCIFMRCALNSLSMHLPMMAISSIARKDEVNQTSDYLLRLSQAILVGILQPGIYLIVSPAFFTSSKIIFNKYSHNTERTWQSRDDPPDEKHERDSTLEDWYSSTGNITGEAGLPLDTNADVERSISFYCTDRKIVYNYM